MNQRGSTEVGRVHAEIELANYEEVLKAKAGTIALGDVRTVKVTGLVDTGATRLVLPQSIVDQLSLPSAGECNVRFADQRTVTRQMVDNAWVRIQGREGHHKAIIEPARSDVLIGAIVLEDLDFVVDCATQTLRPRDPDRIISEIE